MPCLLPDSLSLAQWLIYTLCSVNTCRMNIMNKWAANGLVLTGGTR